MAKDSSFVYTYLLYPCRIIRSRKENLGMISVRLADNWQMRCVGSEEYQNAVVPGTVYTDLLRNGNMADPYYKDNADKVLKLMDEDYEYQTSFSCDTDLLDCRRVVLRFDGIDTIADVFLNGHLLGSPENMHRTWEYEVKELLKPSDNELRVILHSPNKYIAEAYQRSETHGSDDAMEGFVHIRKAHCMFGWDWGAHLPDAGIFRPVTLLGIQETRIDSVYITQNHTDGQVSLQFDVAVQENAADANKSIEKADGADKISYCVKITDPEGNEITADGNPKEITIEEPRLWWPNGYGRQDLYTVNVLLMWDGRVVDEWKRRIGLRTMTMNTQKDEWGNKFALCVNGVDIFAMGADYIPEDHLIGQITPEVTRKLLTKAKWANFNSIRVWGGGYYPEDWFYDLCDELGLVVWQDFMFACAVYDLTPEFEANIRAEFIDNIKRIRHHASLGLWCGNNEMEEFVEQRNSWVTKPQEVRDYLFMYERIIPEVLKQYDPNTFYWPSSPSSGGSFDFPQDPNRGDVHYWEVWHGNKPFTEYRKYFFRYLSEFGFQSFPSMKTIETISDDPADWNIFSYVMEKHQRNGSANGKIMNYMQQTYRYPSDFQTVLYASQLLQADGIRYGVEHFRRNRGRCMGAIYWQLNDCWPVASWSSIDYCGRLKALHYYAKRFFAPLMISCEEQGLMTSGRDLNRQHFDEFEKSIRLNVANETFEDEDLLVRWAVRNPKAEIIKSGEETVKVPALTSVWLDKIDLADIDIYREYISYELVKDGTVVSEGTVNLSYPKYFVYEDPHLTCQVNGNEITVTADAYAKSVEILNDNEDLILSDNYFDMNAGTKTVAVESGDITNLRLRSVFDIR